MGFSQKQSVSSVVFSRNLKTTSARGGVIAAIRLVTCQHAPGADLALIVGPSYSSMGPSGVLRTTRRGPIVSNLAPSGLFLVGALCLSVSMYFQRQPSTTNLSLSRQNDQRQNFEWTACLDEPKRTLSLYPKKRIRCKSFAGHPVPLKNKLQSN